MIELRKIRAEEYEELYTHMKRDFPARGELAPFHAIKRNLEQNIYDGFFITKNKQDIGYAIITPPENLKYSLITYFAVYPEYRSKGYGSEFLKIITKKYPERVLVLEVSDPKAAKSAVLQDEAVRRINFYKRAGFNVLATERAKIFGVDMLIMASSTDSTLNAREIMHSLYSPTFGSVASEWLSNIDIL